MKKYPGDIKKQTLVDMFTMGEQERFKYIASVIMGLDKGAQLPVLVDSDAGKADRYVKGVTKINSRIYEVERTEDPVANTVCIVFGRHND